MKRSRLIPPGAPWLELAEKASIGGSRITPGTRTKALKSPHAAAWRPRACDRCGDERPVSSRLLKGGGESIRLCASCANEFMAELA